MQNHPEENVTSEKKNSHIPSMGRKKAEKNVPLLEIHLTPLNEETGLTAGQVADRKALGQVNIVHKKGERTTGQIVRSHTLTYFNMVNIILGILVFMTGQYKNMLFLGVIICNSAIGIVQELRVKQLIDKLSVITAARAHVRRDGKTQEVEITDIVVDDVVEVAIGDQIVTDGIVLESKGLEVNESMLTGESVPVRKKKGDKILSGSFIAAGTGSFRTEKVGNDCYAVELAAKASKKKRASSEMQNTIQRIIKVVSVAIIPIGLLLYRSQRAAAVATAAAQHYDQHWVFSTSVVRTVSGVIGMIPEGLVLLTSVSFIIGVGRLAYKRALVQEMEAIEALARANVLCTDKTGTITTGELKVDHIETLSDDMSDDYVKNIIAHLNGAFSDSNETQVAVDRYFGKKKDWKAVRVVPFSSERKYKGAEFEGHGAFLIGAPEFMARENAAMMDRVEACSRDGYRVLLLARVEGISDENEPSGKIAPAALVVISDIIKEDARQVFDYFAKSGVSVKVISGDNPVTVSAVARRAGVEGAEKYVDASTLPTDPMALAQEIPKYNVFGRVKPEQKQAFVQAWQKNGNTVAMVGDGVNDVLAIKDADCGIAMANGSEAAKQAAHIVLLDSDFAAMKDIVGEGKTIIANIERVSALYLTKTIYSCLLSLIFSVLQASYPWTTLQMGLINVAGIGMPSFLLTLEQHDDWKSEGFLKHVLKVCLPAALTMVSTMMLVQLLNLIFKWPDSLYSYFCLMLGGLVALLVVGAVCWPLNAWRRFVFAASAIVFLAAILILPGFYDIHSIWTPWSFLLIPIMLFVSMLIYWFSRATNKLAWKYTRKREEEKLARRRA
ncbi:MAG: HAD-IC family P-type ATPase [Lachnospiraceae bacterium]|nr:HAD-IC family P-type ATPase [Lachnospiraceae bacterium]